MEVGMFQTPFLPPEHNSGQVFDHAVAHAVTADQVGLSEYWIGEHNTLNWEASPNPEPVIAATTRQTARIKHGSLTHLLPYYHLAPWNKSVCHKAQDIAPKLPNGAFAPEAA